MRTRDDYGKWQAAKERGEKWLCKHCGEYKTLVGWKGTMCSDCRAVMRAEQRIQRRVWVQDHIDERGGCQDCGESNPLVLEWHHRVPSEKYRNISNMLVGEHSLDRVAAEIAKCDLLCKNCHHKRHYT